MKYLISFIFIGSVFLSGAWAQTQKGSFMLGTTTNLVGVFSGTQPNQTSIGFGKNKVGDNLEEKYTNFNLSFNAGFFAADGLLLGVNLGGWNSHTTLSLKDEEGKVVSESKDQWTDVEIMPVGRYYLNRDQKLQFFGELRGGLQVQKVNDGDATAGAIFGAKAGGAYFLNQKVSLDFFFDYSGAFSEQNNTGGTTTQEFDSGIGLGIGFSFFL